MRDGEKRKEMEKEQKQNFLRRGISVVTLSCCVRSICGEPVKYCRRLRGHNGETRISLFIPPSTG